MMQKKFDRDFSYISQPKYNNIYKLILKTAFEYDYSSTELLEFDYSVNSKDIDRLKDIYNIESLKTGSDICTFINAVNWVSLTLKSNKLPSRPLGCSADIIQDIKKGKYSANCYTYAVVLNDVLCALGYACKYVFCYPIDFHPIDCHVINLAYSVNLKKWVMLDSANNVLYTNDQGELLNIEEFRNYLINDKKININLLDYYTNIESSKILLIKQRLLTYMTKNMYRFGCYKNSQKDREKRNSIKLFYNLVPKSFVKEPCHLTEYDFVNKTKITQYYILDPISFWAPPYFD